MLEEGCQSLQVSFEVPEAHGSQPLQRHPCLLPGFLASEAHGSQPLQRHPCLLPGSLTLCPPYTERMGEASNAQPQLSTLYSKNCTGRGISSQQQSSG